MSEGQKFYGICSTCIHAAHCQQASNACQPIWFCELFDDTVTEKKSPIKNDSPPETQKKSSTKNNSKIKYTGLCINCENRDTCKHANSEGGIWHCSEYR